jgi:hypothetical protein
MPQSPTDWPSVIYWWKYRRNNFVGKVLAGIIFFGALCPSVKLLVFFFERSSDRNGNYRRSIFRQMDFIGDAVGKNFSDELCVLHRRNYSIGKTV